MFVLRPCLTWTAKDYPVRRTRRVKISPCKNLLHVDTQKKWDISETNVIIYAFFKCTAFNQILL